MVYSTLSGWVVIFCNHRAQKELQALAADIQIGFAHVVQLVENYGLENVHEPFVKHLEGKIWEMRLRGRDGIARVAYIAAEGKRVVVLHCFEKKTQQTPRAAIALAIKRAKETGYL